MGAQTGLVRVDEPQTRKHRWELRGKDGKPRFFFDDHGAMSPAYYMSKVGDQYLAIAPSGEVISTQTDAAIAIEDAMGASGGRHVIMSSDVLVVQTVVDMPNSTWLQGQGLSTVLTAATGLDKAVIQNSAYAADTGNTRITLSDFMIDGNSAGQSVEANGGIAMTAADITPNTNITLRDIYVYDVFGHGVLIKGTQVLLMANVVADTNGVAGDDEYHNIYLRRIYRSIMYGAVALSCVAGRGFKFTLCYDSAFQGVAYDNYTEGAYVGSGLGCEYDLVLMDNGQDGSASGMEVNNEVSEVPQHHTIHAIINTHPGDALKLTSLANSPVSGVFRNSGGAGISCAAGTDKIVFGPVRVRDNTGWGLDIAANSDGHVCVGNSFENNTAGGVRNLGTNNIIKHNRGYVTENSGVATLLNGQTAIVVTHGLGFTPAAGDVMVTPIEAWGAMLQFYIDTYTATQFTIHADQDPGQDVDFAWKI